MYYYMRMFEIEFHNFNPLQLKYDLHTTEAVSCLRSLHFSQKLRDSLKFYAFFNYSPVEI